MLITSDLHLTDAPIDEYRWGIFDFLEDHLRKEPQPLFILGDLTDAKDNHSSRLVNRIADKIAGLTSIGSEIIVLRGNHDGLDPGWPFFRFLRYFPSVRYIAYPRMIALRDGTQCAMIPHIRNDLLESIGESMLLDMRKASFIFMHQTVSGVMLENGTVMQKGVSAKFLGKYKAKIYSGDVHVPQTTNGITYVGSPYTVHFNDKFKPRILQFNGCKETDLHFETVRRHTLRISQSEDLPKALRQNKVKSGDQIKVVLDLPRRLESLWKEHCDDVEATCRDNGVSLCDLRVEVTAKITLEREIGSLPLHAPSDINFVDEYITKHHVPEPTAKAGRRIVRGKK